MRESCRLRRCSRILHETPTTAVLDAADGIGQVAGVRGMELAVAKAIKEADVTPLGSVVASLSEGRGEAEVTIFDGSGVALQDLAVASAVLDLARQQGKAQQVEI